MSLPREISVAELSGWLDDPARERPVLLDVRRDDEWQIAKLDGAVLVPLHELEERRDELLGFQGKPVVVYCHHGVRSLSGAGFARALGLDATSLRGGIDAWSLEIDAKVPRY